VTTDDSPPPLDETKPNNAPTGGGRVDAVSDAERHNLWNERLAAQRFGVGLQAAVVVAIAVCIAWCGIFGVVGFNTGLPEIWFVSSWCALLSGLAIGYPLRRLGHGVEPRFATAGAVLGFAATFLGDFFLALPSLDAASPTNFGVFTIDRGLWDWVLYAIAAWGGSRLARERLTEAQIDALVRRGRQATEAP
jgi:hypothetical protein